MRARNGALALVVTVVSALVVLPGSVLPAAATTATVNGTLNCVAHAPVIGDQSVTQTFTVNTDAPASVLPGHQFSITAQTPVSQIATSQSGGTVSSVTNISYKFPVPANSSFVSASLSGGSNIGSGTPTIVLQGSATTGNLVFSVPGPIPAGQNYQLPAVTVNLTATGADFSTISLKMGGTSTSDPGFTTTAVVTSPISASVPTECYPAPPNPAWTTTTIVPPDVTAPTISLNTPATGGQYPLGGNVAANYQCSDGQFGSGVATCAGDVPNGAPIDTSSLGSHSFTVTSTDNNGNTAAPVTHTYTVVPPGNDHTPPDITLSVPPNGAVYQQNASVAANFGCVDTGSGIASCAGTVANGAAINTATVGPHSFTVSASDGEGNTFSVVHSYRINPPATQQNWSTGDVTNRMPVGCDTLLNAFHESIPVASNVAPTLAGAGSQFTWSMAIDTDVVPTLNNGTGLIYRWKKPTNAHFVSAAFTGPGTSVNGTAIAINPDGTLQITIASVTDQSILGFGDDSFKPPPFSAVIQVDGAAGSVIQNKFDYFQITTTTIGLLTTTQHCPAGDTFNNRVNVALTNTVVVDATPPVITISSPVNGQMYAPGADLHFTYSCTDNSGTPTCVGDAPNGSALDSSTSGTHLLHVTSTDAAGNTAAQYVSYSIADPTVSVANASVTEGPGATLDFAVTLSNPSSRSVGVDYSTADGSAVAPGDYTGNAGSVTFAPGDPLTQTVSIPVNTAGYFAGTRQMTLSLVSALHATIGSGTATGSIVGADPPAITTSDAAVTEGPGAKLDFTVTLAAQPLFPVSVNYQTIDGTATTPSRYAAANGTLVFNPGGALVQHVLVTVVDDSIYNETAGVSDTQAMSLSATDTVNGFSSIGTGTITDNEIQPPLLSIGSATIREGDASPRAVKLSVTLNKQSLSSVTVHYTTQADNATAPTDFKVKTGTLTFKPKVVTATISVAVLGDMTPEPDETFSVKLVNPSGALLAHDTGTVTILNDDGPSASAVEATVSDASIYEGGGGKTTKISFLVSLNKAAGTPVTITYTTVAGSATAGTDYKAKSGTLTFTAKQVAKGVTISVIADNGAEPDETVKLVLTGASSPVTITGSTGTGTIFNDD